MKETAAPSTSPSRLQEALLEYFSAPGKYQLSLREPSLLFASVREILQVAAGRGAGAADSEPLRQAAIFFIRAALLYPGADHYAVLGYATRADPADIKERYRLLMRLTHPDFAAAGSAAWPADAAVRVNRAYEVLSSPVLRREYDEQLGTHRPVASAAPASGNLRSVPSVRRMEPARRESARKVVAVIATLLAAAGIGLLLPRSEPDQLVQRTPLPLGAREHQAQVAAESAAAALPAALVSSERLSVPQAQAQAQPPIPAPESRSDLHAAALPAPEVRPVPEASAARAAPEIAETPARPVLQAVAPAPARAHAPAPAIPHALRTAAEVRRPVARHAPTQPVLDTPIREWQEPLPAVPVPTRSAPRPVEPLPKQPVISVAIPAPIPQAATVPLPIPLAPPPPAVAHAGPAAPTLADAQPVLTHLLQVMEAGNGEQLLRLLDAKARQTAGARGLSRQFDHLAEGGRSLRVSQVEFQGEVREGVLLVTGRMRVHAGEPTIGALGQKFILRAEFVTRGGKATLTGLSGATE
jgi:hypothetical protein